MSVAATTWCGQSIERVEDAALLTGRGRFIDDLGEKPGTLHAAILRSPYAHAHIKHIDADAARGAPGVVAVVTGSEVTKLSASLAVGVRAPIECWPIAVGARSHRGCRSATPAQRILPTSGQAHRSAQNKIVMGSKSIGSRLGA